MNPSIAGITIPDSKIAHEVTELIRDTESPLLFHHQLACICLVPLLVFVKN